MSVQTGMYFAQFPRNFDQLQATLFVVQNENQNGLSETSTQPGKFYREIIFTLPDLLMAPHFDEPGKTFIIAETSVLTSVRLCNMLDKFSLKMVKNVTLTRNLFMYCFEFVLKHRLAPFWNKIGSCYIKGKDFLHDEGKMCAIEAVFSLTDKMTIALKALMLKLPPFQLENCGISPNILQQFYKSSSSVIHGHSLENNKCLVLPSLKTGYITCIAHRNTEDIDFKRYWKVMVSGLQFVAHAVYGFRVPESQPQDLVLTISFPGCNNVFSYPECCIKSREPLTYLRCDQKAIFASFMQDLTSRLPSLCAGAPLKITSSSLLHVKKLSSATVANQTNLTKTMTLSNASHMFVCTASHGNTGKIPETLTNTAPMNTDLLTKKTVQAKTAGSWSDPESKPYVPNFTYSRRSSSGHVTKKTISKKSSQTKFSSTPTVPCFQKKTSSSKKPAPLVHQTRTSKAASNVRSDHASQNPAPETSKALSSVRSDIESQISHANAASKTPMSLAAENDLVFSGLFRTGPEERTVAVTTNVVSNAKETSVQAGQPAGSSVGHNTMNDRIQQLKHVQKRTPETNKECPAGNSQVKKRAKLKQQDDTNIDIRRLAIENKLSKVNAAVITKWLKAQGVPCKSKDKKADLVSKVYTHLDLNRSEP